MTAHDSRQLHILREQLDCTYLLLCGKYALPGLLAARGTLKMLAAEYSVATSGSAFFILAYGVNGSFGDVRRTSESKGMP